MAEDKEENMKSKSKNVIIGLLMVVLLLIVVVGGYFVYVKNNVSSQDNDKSPVVAEMKGQKIHLSEYKERLFAALGGQGTPTAPAYLDEGIKTPVLNELVDLKIVDTELAKRNITIADDELKAEAQKKFIGYEKADQASQKAFRNYVRLKVGKDKLLSSVTTWKEGFALYCHFDRADQDDMRNKLETEVVNMRALQGALAKDYCTKAKERLESGKTDFKSEQEALKDNAEIGDAVWQPYTMSFGDEITKETLSNANLNSDYDLFSQLSSLGNEKNKYYLLTIKKATLNEQGISQKKDAMYAVVYVKDGQKGETTDFAKWLQDKQKESEVKTYIERIKI